MDKIQELRNKLPKRERRLIEGATELRATSDTGAPKIGMRIPFGKRSHDMGFIEIIDAHAFDKTLAERGSDVVALWNHDPLWVLGRQSNRTLSVKVTDGALEGEAELDGADVMHQHFAGRVKRGDVVGSSFGFNTVRDSWEEDRDAGTIVRTLLEVRLFDLSPVTYPAYPDSEAESRALGDTRLVEIAAARGIDPLEFVRVMASSQGGKIEERHVESVTRWIGQLQGMLPAAEVIQSPLELRKRKLDLFGKKHGIAA
jgi:HK97 family phage prohead protease